MFPLPLSLAAQPEQAARGSEAEVGPRMMPTQTSKAARWASAHSAWEVARSAFAIEASSSQTLQAELCGPACAVGGVLNRALMRSRTGTQAYVNVTNHKP